MRLYFKIRQLSVILILFLEKRNYLGRKSNESIDNRKRKMLYCICHSALKPLQKASKGG